MDTTLEKPRANYIIMPCSVDLIRLGFGVRLGSIQGRRPSGTAILKGRYSKGPSGLRLANCVYIRTIVNCTACVLSRFNKRKSVSQGQYGLVRLGFRVRLRPGTRLRPGRQMSAE